MNDRADPQLLRIYVETRSEAAFAELVRRHVDFVYSAALRMVRDPHLAEDVTQSVFVAFAKNAAQLTNRRVLSGWLHRTAQNIAAHTVRTIERRRAREQEAVAMNELLSTEPDAVWDHIAPHLDEALGELGEGDRDAVLLRYFEHKSAREMAKTLGTSEDAAQRRVSRAVERLREFFAKRGVTSTSAILTALITGQAVTVAPAGLAAIITGSSLASAAAGAGTGFTIFKFMGMTKLKIGLVGAIVAAGCVAPLVVQQTSLTKLREENATLREGSRELDQLREENERMAKLEVDAEELERLRAEHAELVRLRGLVAAAKREAEELNGLRVENVRLRQSSGKPMPSFEHPFLPRATWANGGLQTPGKALETFLWAWTTKNETALAEVCTKDINGQPTKLTGLATDWDERVMGVQVLSFGFQKGNPDQVRCSMIAEMRTEMENQNGPFEGLTHQFLNLQFKREDGMWRFDGRPPY